MCGIIASASRSNVVPDLIVGLERLEYRGCDSAGVSVADGEQVTTVKSAGRVEALVGEIPDGLSGVMGIGHTRWATQGRVTTANAHPHSCGTVSLAHNGIVENFDELLQEFGDVPRLSETDSELLAVMVADYLKKGCSVAAAVRKTFDRLRGENAVCVITGAPAGQEVLAISRKALVVGRDRANGKYFVASDAYSLEPLSTEIAIVEPGNLLVMTGEGVWTSDASDQRRPLDDAAFASVTRSAADDGSPSDAGGDGSFMRQEIASQPAMARTIIGNVLAGSAPGADNDYQTTVRTITEATDAMTAISCGSSHYAARIGKYWFERMAGVPFNAEIASEFVYKPRLLPPRSTLLAISQSGETADTLVALRRTNHEGYEKFVALCNTKDSSIPRESDHFIPMGAGREVSVAATKTFTAQLLHLFWLAVAARKQRAPNVPRPELTDQMLLDGLREIPELIERVLALDDVIREVARNIQQANSMLFIARGILLPIAHEAALKMKEVSYIHAEAYAGGELKHGSLALVDKELPVIALASTGSITEKIKANVREIRAREGRVFLFCDEELFTEQTTDSPHRDTIILPKTHYLLTPIVTAVAVQLLAYHVSNLKGIDLDRPRNLAKSVTVE